MATAEMDAPTFYATRIQELRNLPDGWYNGDGKAPNKSDVDIVAELVLKLEHNHIFDVTPHPVGDIYLELTKLSGTYEGIIGVISNGTVEITGYPPNFLPQMDELVAYQKFNGGQITEIATFINELLQ